MDIKMDIIADLDQMVIDTKRVRALAIAELRSMDPKDLAKLEPNNVGMHSMNRLVKKVYHYPSDLTVSRLASVLKTKKVLGL